MEKEAKLLNLVMEVVKENHKLPDTKLVSRLVAQAKRPKAPPCHSAPPGRVIYWR